MGEGVGTAINSYRDLLVWKAAMELAVQCYEVTKSYPARERYGLSSQIQRASVSIAANIAEGHGRDGTGFFVQFLRVSQGSLKELETHLILSNRIGFLGEDRLGPLMAQCDQIGRMLRSLIRSLQERQQ